MEEKSRKQFLEELCNRHPDLAGEFLTCYTIMTLSGFIAGAVNGFCNARNIHSTLGIENYIMAAPIAFGVISGGAMEGRVLRAFAKDEIRRQGKTLDFLESGDYKEISVRATIKEALYFGAMGVVATTIGFGAGYAVGFLTK